MTFQESIRMQESISRRLEFLASSVLSPPPGFNSLLLASCNSIVQSLSSTYTTVSSPSSVASTLPLFQQQIMQLYAGINYSGIELALKTFERIPNTLLSTITLINDLPNQPLLDSLAHTIAQVEPYLPQEEREECERVIQPKLSKESRTRLTLSDALSILSILLSILFFVLGSMPDDQAERIIQQQNKIIANQEAEIAQLREKDQALVETLNSLSDSINLLTDEIELLRDEFEDSDNLPDSPNRADPGERQQDDSDAQD